MGTRCRWRQYTWKLQKRHPWRRNFIHCRASKEQQDVSESQEVEEHKAEGEEGEKKEAKTYTQDEVDRIAKEDQKRNAPTSPARRPRRSTGAGRRAGSDEVGDAAASAEDERPKRDDFEDYEAFMRAEARFEARQEFKALQQQERQRSQQQSQATTDAQRLQRFNADLAKTREAVADFDEVVDAADVPVTQAMRDAILESEVGALLTYHLAKNPAEAQRISQLSHVAQIKALGAIEASLMQKPALQVSKAPSPITPINSGTRASPDPSKMSMDEYQAWRKKNGARWAR